jgi:hypothetical protein
MKNASAGQTVLFPIRLDDAMMDTKEPWAAKLRTQRHIGDFRLWKDHAVYNRSVEDLIVRMAKENRSWGYDRIAGALANLNGTIKEGKSTSWCFPRITETRREGLCAW